MNLIIPEAGKCTRLDELLIQYTICEYFTFRGYNIEVIFMASLRQVVYEENTLKKGIPV